MSPRPWLALVVLIALPALADDAPAAKPGHSMLGETFDEGPRQFAHLFPGATSVHFPVTTKSLEAQRFIDQGVTQLHGFWYFEAERSFRQAAYLDHDCAMAYWGMAMANVNNMKRAAGFSAEAVKRRGQASAREQRWIDAWAAFCNEKSGDEKGRRSALVKAYEDLSVDFPEDLEARAFLLYQLWDNNTSEAMPLPSRLAAAALAQPVLAANPMHPGIHHYLIHLWNKDGTDKRALPDAALCGQSAPAIAHLWHMPGHTYSSLQRYADAAWQQEASARVDHAYMREARILPEQIFNYAHNNDWLAKDLGYIGRVHDAMALAKNLVELPRLGPGRETAWHLGRERLMDLGTTFELWEELSTMDGTAYLSPDPNPVQETHRLRALALAWYGKGDLKRGGEKLALLEKQLAQTKAERIPEAAKAEEASNERKETEEKAATAIAGALRKNTKRAEALEGVLAEVRTARDLAQQDYAAAWEEFPKLKELAPMAEARWREALGDHAGAEVAVRKALAKDKGQVLPYALLARIEEAQGKTAEADRAFDDLRARSVDLDLAVPAFARLAPLAARRHLGEDWRAPRPVVNDVGVRPPLDELGPFRWSPYLAPPLSLPDAAGQPVSLESYHGKPVLLLFYLGAGCGRCIRQLNAFAPEVASFAQAGIEIIAVSTDSPDGLKSTFEQAKEGGSFPFKIVSDAGRDTFRAFRAFDDFESIPLHGAFLIDGEGFVRWQNISFEPFEDPKWLLEEAKRLLTLPAQAPAVASAR